MKIFGEEMLFRTLKRKKKGGPSEPVFSFNMNRRIPGISIPKNQLTTGGSAWFDDLVNLNVKAIRFDFYWDQLQDTIGGPYNWASVEGLVDAAVSRGINVLGLITGKPKWGPGNRVDPLDHDRYAEFAAAAALHFKDRCSNWELENEPNNGAMTPENFTSCMKKAYTAIKAVNPVATVIHGGLASVWITNTGSNFYTVSDWITRMYAAGGQGYFDALGVNPYTWPYWISDNEGNSGWWRMVNTVRPLMVNNGDGSKKVWITEFGYPTEGDADPAYLNEDSQIVLVNELFSYSESLSWVGPIFWYSYRDIGGDVNNEEYWFGLVRPDGTRKPAFDTFAAKAAALP